MKNSKSYPQLYTFHLCSIYGILCIKQEKIRLVKSGFLYYISLFFTEFSVLAVHNLNQQAEQRNNGVVFVQPTKE